MTKLSEFFFNQRNFFIKLFQEPLFYWNKKPFWHFYLCIWQCTSKEHQRYLCWIKRHNWTSLHITLWEVTQLFGNKRKSSSSVLFFQSNIQKASILSLRIGKTMTWSIEMHIHIFSYISHFERCSSGLFDDHRKWCLFTCPETLQKRPPCFGSNLSDKSRSQS